MAIVFDQIIAGAPPTGGDSGSEFATKINDNFGKLVDALGIAPAQEILLSSETAEIYDGITNVDDALKRAIVDYSSYQAFCANVNANSLDSAFGKNNFNYVKGLGIQLAMYAWYKGVNATTYPLNNLKNIKDGEELGLLASVLSVREMLSLTEIATLIQASPFYSEYLFKSAVATKLYTAGTFYNGFSDLVNITRTIGLATVVLRSGIGTDYTGLTINANVNVLNTTGYGETPAIAMDGATGISFRYYHPSNINTTSTMVFTIMDASNDDVIWTSPTVTEGQVSGYLYQGGLNPTKLYKIRVLLVNSGHSSTSNSSTGGITDLCKF